jgi:hypothetical protein
MKTIITSLAVVAALSTPVLADSTKEHKDHCYSVSNMADVAMVSRQVGLTEYEAILKMNEEGYDSDVAHFLIGQAYGIQVVTSIEGKFQTLKWFSDTIYNACLNSPAKSDV